MEVRNLLIITGEWGENTTQLVYNTKKIISKASNNLLDILVVNSGEYKFNLPHYSITTNSDTKDLFYNFICLSKAVNFKQNQQLENLIEYAYCFHLSTELESIDLDLELILPQSRNIVCLGGTKATDINLIFPSTKFWVTTGLDFDGVGSLYKSNIQELFLQNGHTSSIVRQGTTVTPTDLLSGLFLAFLNTLHIHEVYLSLKEATTSKDVVKVTPSRKNNSKPTVAICLSGETRSLELTIDFFKYLSKVEEIDFHFFIATWESNYSEALRKIPNLKSICILNEQTYTDNLNVENRLSNNHRYSFLLKKCNLLKQDYEIENNFVYDYVVMSRPDCVFAGLFECVTEMLLNKGYAEFNNNLYLSDSIQYNKEHFNADDNIALGSSYISDIYSNIHFIYYNNTLNRFYHSLQVNAFIIGYYNLNPLQLPFRNIIIRPCNLNKWLVAVKGIDYTNRETGRQLGNIKREVNNLRMQEGFKGTILIDIRKYDILLTTSGYLPALEHYLYNLGWRTGSSNLIILCTHNQKISLQEKNICKFFTVNSIHFETENSIVESFVKHEPISINVPLPKKRYVAIEPEVFLNYQHNKFASNSLDYNFSLLANNKNTLDNLVTFDHNVFESIRNEQVDTVKNLIDLIESRDNFTKLVFDTHSITGLDQAILELAVSSVN